MSLILWSGGCDSTLLLQRLLRNEMSYTGVVRALSIDCEQVCGNKQMVEARNVIKMKLKKLGLEFEHIEIKIEGSAFFSGSGLIQPALWVSFGVASLDKEEDLYLGWIEGDDVWHYKQEISETFHSLTKLQGKSGRIFTPLEWFSKEVVLSNLEKDLLDSCWYCESEKNEPCGICSSCWSVRKARWVIETKHNEVKCYDKLIQKDRPSCLEAKKGTKHGGDRATEEQKIASEE